jgi:hypothetical protein
VPAVFVLGLLWLGLRRWLRESAAEESAGRQWRKVDGKVDDALAAWVGDDPAMRRWVAR